MPGPRAVLALLVAAAAVASCAGAAQPRRAPARAPAMVSVGRPIAPRPVTVPGAGTIELRAPSPTRDRRPRWLAIVLATPGADPRDVCVATGPARAGLGEANASCAVRAPGIAASFVAQAGPLTVVSGLAPPDVRAVRVTGAGGTRTLPLSAHRAFLALYAPSVHGRVRIVSVGGATVTRSFTLPLPPRWSLRRSRHPVRRAGAVFDDEVGENVVALTRNQVVRRFGAPAAERTEHGRRCAYYEVVGRARRGWRFCFARDGRMRGASGNTALP